MEWISYEYESGLSRWINLSRATDIGFAERDGMPVAYVRLAWDDVGYTITVEDADGIAAIKRYLTAHEFHPGRM
jgi:hypothetical protein